MTNQRQLISEMVEEYIDIKLVRKHHIEVWTPQSAQGNERDIIIMSICLDRNSTGRGNYHKNPRLLNVATSRAKKYTFVVHSSFPQNKYPQLAKYLGLTKESFSWKLNHNQYESEFERKVYSYLKKYIDEKQNEADLRIYNQVETCGQKRLDFVIHNKNNDQAVAIEVDGSRHYNNNSISVQYSEGHIERIDTLKRAGWNIINTPYYKWYNNGWLCNNQNLLFLRELDRITQQLDVYLF
jgi:very-short-patch-repair endonuclease